MSAVQWAGQMAERWAGCSVVGRVARRAENSAVHWAEKKAEKSEPQKVGSTAGRLVEQWAVLRVDSRAA